MFLSLEDFLVYLCSSFTLILFLSFFCCSLFLKSVISFGIKFWKLINIALEFFFPKCICP